ncbi:MAG TPA: S9 family peptidase [Gemmatimonadales bacterium]|nr:S9 family peptidase [Gemmatimonadales bacterium]
MRVALLALFVLLIHPEPRRLSAQGPDLSVHRIFGTRDFANRLEDIEWLHDGSAYTLLASAGSETNLYRVDPVSGDSTLVVRGRDLVAPGTFEPLDVDEYEFSRDGSKILIYTNSVRVWRQNTKGTYYVWDLAAKRLIPVSQQPGYQMFAKFSPDARLVGFVRDNNIFVTDLATGAETALTTDGGENIINGTSDWVYEEELDLRDAFRFSPDGQRIAFWRLDQTAVKTYYLINADSLYPTLFPVRYPKAGEANATVKIGVVEIAGGRTTWMDLGADANIYVSAMDFAESPTEIWLTRLNRRQNREDLLLADAKTGASRVLVSDTDSAWVDTHQPIWIDEGKQFLLESEREGFRQIYLYSRAGKLVRRLTPGGWDVTEVYGADDKARTVWFTGAIDGPLGRPVLRVGLDGKGLARVSSEPGTHNPEFDPNHRYYVDTYSRAGVPPVQVLRQADGKAVRTIADNHVLAERVAALRLTPPEFLKVRIADGTELNAVMIKGRDFDATKRYPLFMWVYGGPGSQSVVDTWGGPAYLWYQMLAQQGYVVASVDGRGTGARGAAFKRVTYLHLGRYESRDQIAAARYFANLGYVDPSRVGLWGWSYGGYVASRTLFLGGDTFRAAIAVAPVTDWRFYDTIYTERYMGMPAENPDGYNESAPLTYADSLRGRLLLVHGTGDDNVHFQNTIRLVQRLERANKQFDMRIYPNKTHSISGGNTSENLFGLLTDWLKRNL